MSEIDVVLGKINIIKNCLMAIEKATLKEKDTDFLLAIYEINLQRAIQACIDLANILVAKEGLGLPKTYRQSFDLLFKSEIISQLICERMISMVGFRNISVHDYSEIKPEIVHSIIKNNLVDFENFYELIFNHAKKW